MVVVKATTVIAVLGIALVALAGCTAENSPAAGDRTPVERGSTTPSTNPHPCARTPKPSCDGTVTVPMDRARAELGTITVAFRWIPPTDRSVPTAGAIVHAVGGPGFAAIMEETAAAKKIYGPLLRHRGLLLMDYRGVGKSTYLACPGLPDPSTAVAQARPAPQHVRACVDGLGPKATSFDTAAAADDLEDVRRALRLGAIDLYGVSYGALFAEVFSRRHPDAVRTLTLDGGLTVRAADPTSYWSGEADTATWALQVLPDACRRLACLVTGDPAQLWRNLVTKVRTADDSAVRVDDLTWMLPLGPDLPEMLRAGQDYLRGKRQALHALVRTNRQERAEDARADAAQKPDQNDSGALFLQVMCNDQPVPFDRAAPADVRRRQYDAAVKALPEGTFGPFRNAEWLQQHPPTARMCIDWPASNHPTAPNASPYPSTPTLVMTGQLDPLTPSARQAAHRFPNAVHIEIALGGHGVNYWTACAQEITRGFIETTRLPARTCQADPAVNG